MSQAVQQELMLADDLFPAVIFRNKTNTICGGHRDLTTGLTRLKPTEDSTQDLLVDVTVVKKCIFHELTIEDLRREGIRVELESFDDTLAMFLEAMKRFYPDMTMDSPVTVINFNYLYQL